MRRDVYKFLTGMFAGFAIEHALVAVYISQGVLNQPHFFGREWGAGSGWFGAVLYSAISLWLGYLGWRSAKPAAGAGTQTKGTPREE